MRNLKLWLVAALLSFAIFIPSPAPASAIPITPTINSCTSPNVTFFANRVCFDPTTGAGKLVGIYTNNKLVAAWSVYSINPAYGCTASNVFSGVWFPATATYPYVRGMDTTSINASLVFSAEYNLSCGGSLAYLDNVYFLGWNPGLAQIAGVLSTHVLIAVA